MILSSDVKSFEKGNVMLLNRLFKRKNMDSCQSIAIQYYQRAVDQARDQQFYNLCNVNDDPRGRFEMLSIHLFLMMRRLKDEKIDPNSSHQINQELCDLFVADMDHCLRDLQLSELKIDKQYKIFVEGFYGRLMAYDKALETTINKGESDNLSLESSKLLEALVKNIYNGCKESENYAKILEFYIKSQLIFMKNCKLFDLHFKIGTLI